MKANLGVWIIGIFMLLGASAYAISPNVIISEVHYNANGSVQDFIELQVLQNNTNVAGWAISTLDNDQITLPFVANLGQFDYVAIYPGFGVSQLNANNGTASIYLGIASDILDNIGDEVALYNSALQVVDYMRYGAGNGDPVLAGWSLADPGPFALPGGSVQIHGPDTDTSTNWVSATYSAGEPNFYETIFVTGLGARYRNGANRDIVLDDEEKFGSLNFSVVRASPAVTLAELKILEEMANYSANFYAAKGFNPPFTGIPGGTLNISVTKNNNFAASASPKGTMTIDIGGNLSHRHVGIFMKWNIEHEFYHLLEYGRFFPNGTNNPRGPFNHDPVNYSSGGKFAYLDEGQAEYWGLEIAKAQYGTTEDEAFAASLNISKTYAATFQSIPYNISDILKTFDVPLIALDTGSGIKVYTHGYLWVRFIRELFGENKLIHIHNVTKNNLTGSGSEIIGQQAILAAFTQQGIPTTIQNLFMNWTVWLYGRYNQSLGFTYNDSFNGATLTETDTMHPWGSDFEKFRINRSSLNSNGPYEINFSGSGPYGITVIIKNASGSYIISQRQFTGSTIFTPVSNADDFILIKTRFGSFSGASTGYTVRFRHANVTNSNLSGVTFSNGSITGSTIRNSTITQSTVTGSVINRSTIHNSSVTSSILVLTVLNASTVTQSTLNSSRITASSVTNSRIRGSNVTTSVIANANLSFTQSNLSRINASTVSGSAVINGTIVNSTLTGSNVFRSTINGSTVQTSTANNTGIRASTVTGSKVVGGSIGSSTVLNSSLTSTSAQRSLINRSTLTGGTLINATVQLSTLATSLLNNSIATNSTIVNSTVTNSIKINSIVNLSRDISSRVVNSIEKNSTVFNSTLVNVTVINSVVRNSNLSNCIIINNEIVNLPSCGPFITVLAPPSVTFPAVFQLNAPLFPNQFYYFALSFTANTGITLPDGRVIPLDFDPLFQVSVTNPQSIGLFNSFGYLNNQGLGNVQLILPHIPSLVGYSFYGAFITISPTGGQVTGISPAVQLVINP